MATSVSDDAFIVLTVFQNLSVARPAFAGYPAKVHE